MTTIKTSIVLPTFNQSNFLLQAIQSILNQTYKSFELIIVNDGSTDETEKLLSSIQHPQIKIITQKNQGLPSALNAGFEIASGEYWTWTSTDNTASSNWLEELVKALDNSPPEIAYAFSYYAVTDENGKILFVNQDQRFDLPSLLLRHAGNASFLYRASLAKRVGLYDTNLAYAEDLDMWIRMAEKTRAVQVENILYYYRQHENSMTASQNKVREATTKTVNKYLEKSNGKFNIDELFPSIGLSKDPSLERWKSRIWLASLGASAYFYCPVDALVDQLRLALDENYESGLVGNIVHLYAKIQRFDLAANIIATYQKQDDSDYLKKLADLIERKAVDELKNIPFLTIDENLLATDCISSLSPKQLMRNLAPLPSANPLSFDKVVVSLAAQLEDIQNHDKVWNNISALQTPEEKEYLHHLRLYLTDLVNIPQNPNAMLIIATLEAVCYAYTVNGDAAKERLLIMKKQVPDAAVLKTALFHLDQTAPLLA